MKNIISISNKNILKSYPTNEIDSFYTNTLMNTDLLCLTYGVDVSCMTGCCANSISDNTLEQLRIASGKQIDNCNKLEVYGLSGVKSLYHIHDGEIDYICSDGSIEMCSIFYTLHFLDIFANHTSRGVYEWGEFYDYNIRDIDEVMAEYIFNSPIFNMNENIADEYIETSMNTFRLWNSILAIIELSKGCYNVNKFLRNVMHDENFDLRERYPFIDVIGLELQKYEKRIKYVENRFQWWFKQKAC